MSNKKARKTRKQIRYFDYFLLALIIFMLFFGLVMLYSASSYTAEMRFGSASYFVKKQLKFCIMGLVIMIMVSFIDYHFWFKIRYLVYLFPLACCAIVLVKGSTDYGSQRWLSIGGISFQPSELAKISLILVNAYILTKISFLDKDFKKRIKKFLLAYSFTIADCILIAITNLSTAVIVATISLLMYFVAYPRTRLFVILIAAVIFLGSLILKASSSYRGERFKIWKHPENYAKGYQTLQGLYAIGSGGFFGKGLGGSLQKKFVPEAQNDMIFPLIVEELGIFGAVVIISVFIVFLWRLYRISRMADDKGGSFIAIGVMIHIAIQVMLNIAVATNSIPNTGVTLPFFSYGGSSTLILMVELGIVLNVSRSVNFAV